jgi:tRNA-splicing ligase RtcB
MNIKIFSPANMPPDEGAIKQMQNCMASGDPVGGSLSADHHLGYSAPIGSSIAYRGHISPSGVGYDIGCGNKAVSTSLFYSDVRKDLPKIMDEIASRISFGMGRPNDEPVDHPVFDEITKSNMPGVVGMRGLAAKQLGTVGSGNHYVDLFREEGTDRIWIGVHFGSRGFGHKIATGFLALAQGKAFDERPDAEDTFAPPTLLRTDSSLGFLYIESMTLAGAYAYAGRDTVVNKVLEILGNPAVLDEVHNHHNYAWEEDHCGEEAWVVRKGATPLWPGQRGFVGGSMGENAVIIEGSVDYMPNAFEVGEEALWSAPHGAGRAMSRTEAKGKSRKRCQCFSCGHTQSAGEAAFQVCPMCSHPTIKKVWIRETEGKVDWKAAKKNLVKLGIELRGGDADEAPAAYKRLPEVLAAHSDYVIVRHELRPIGVAMAGSGTRDLYPD